MTIKLKVKTIKPEEKGGTMSIKIIKLISKLYAYFAYSQRIFCTYAHNYHFNFY